ncbi:hypothetical protein BDQ17DRAFT_1434994 [Cyathus striatus]|nr:hypothetical protein BDQ17DRAFT_1434994 [Cyathus striatus]
MHLEQILHSNVKIELDNFIDLSGTSLPPSDFTTHQDEILVIFSEDEMDIDTEVTSLFKKETGYHDGGDLESESMVINESDGVDESDDEEYDSNKNPSSDENDASNIEDDSLSTIWLDDDVKMVKIETGLKSITTRLKVQAVEYMKGVPTAWPIPHQMTAYVIDLSDNKYHLTDKNGQLLPVDAIIKDKDKDSWEGTSGQKDSPAQVLNILGSKAVLCCQSHIKCQGIWACEYADSELLNVTCCVLDLDANEAHIHA